MKRQTRIGSKNKTCFRSGGERNVKGILIFIYHLVVGCQFIFVLLMDCGSKNTPYLPCPFKKHL